MMSARARSAAAALLLVAVEANVKDKFWGFLEDVSNEKRERSDVTTIAELLDQGAGVHVESCGGKSDAMTVSHADFIRASLQVRAYGSLSRNVSGGTLHVKMYKGSAAKGSSTEDWLKREMAWHSVPHAYEEDLCKHFSKSHSRRACPLPAGDTELRLALDKLPPMVVAGAYKLKIKATDEAGKSVACLRAQVDVPRGKSGELFRRVEALPTAPSGRTLSAHGQCMCGPSDPVCGDDGRTYAGACEAGCANVGVAYPGSCAGPARLGERELDRRTSTCVDDDAGVVTFAATNGFTVTGCTDAITQGFCQYIGDYCCDCPGEATTTDMWVMGEETTTDQACEDSYSDCPSWTMNDECEYDWYQENCAESCGKCTATTNLSCDSVCGGSPVNRSATYYDPFAVSTISCGDLEDYCASNSDPEHCAGGDCSALEEWVRHYTPCCETESSCPATCYDRTCDEYVGFGYTCDYVETWGCDCSGCDCAASTPAPTAECVCTEEYDPVCVYGYYDYENTCYAECDGTDYGYWNWDDLEYGTDYVYGTCSDEECVCTEEYDPVCLYDYYSYQNTCYAECDDFDVDYIDSDDWYYGTCSDVSGVAPRGLALLFSLSLAALPQ